MCTPQFVSCSLSTEHLSYVANKTTTKPPKKACNISYYFPTGIIHLEARWPHS